MTGSPAFARFVRATVVVALSAAGLTLASATPVAATPGAAPMVPDQWLNDPVTDSIENGDHALDLNFNFGVSSVVSSAAHDYSAGERGTDAGFTALVHTADGTTGKLPPTVGSIPVLDGARVGVTPTSTLVQGPGRGLAVHLPGHRSARPEHHRRLRGVEALQRPLHVPAALRREHRDLGVVRVRVHAGPWGRDAGPTSPAAPGLDIRTLRYCNSGDHGGTRYLVAPTAGATFGSGNNLTSDFVADGDLDSSASSGQGGVAYAIPSLAVG